MWFVFMIANKSEELLDLQCSNIHVENLWATDSSFFKKHRIIELVKNLLIFRRKVKHGDVLFLYGFTNYMFLLASSIARRTKIVCEITEHPEYKGRGFVNRSRIYFGLYFLKKFDGLFVISHSLKQYFLSKGILEDKIQIVNMFVNAERFSVKKKNTNLKYIAYCGSVSKIKDGVDILIRSFCNFNEVCPGYLLYIIGGSGDDEKLQYFENLAKELGLEGKVVFTGKIPSEQIPDLLLGAQMLVLARPDSLQARNGFPTKLGEYLATGVPVVVTDVGEIGMFIKDQENGFLVKPSDVEAFSSKIIWVAQHPEESEIIAKRGLELVKTDFSDVVQVAHAWKFIRDHCIPLQ